MVVYWGMPKTEGFYTMICNIDYPATIPISRNWETGATLTGVGWTDNILTMPDDQGNW